MLELELGNGHATIVATRIGKKVDQTLARLKKKEFALQIRYSSFQLSIANIGLISVHHVHQYGFIVTFFFTRREEVDIRIA